MFYVLQSYDHKQVVVRKMSEGRERGEKRQLLTTAGDRVVIVRVSLLKRMLFLCRPLPICECVCVCVNVLVCAALDCVFIPP